MSLAAIRSSPPRLALAAFCAMFFVAALLHPGHGAESVDIRTYVQMIGAVARSGVPAWDNGPVDRYPELVVPWAVNTDGRLWGVYGPLYPYLAAPVFLLFGRSLRAVSGLTFALHVPIALLTFALARRLGVREWLAVLAAVLTSLSTPLLAKSLEISAYPLAALTATAATLLAVDAVRSPRRAFPSGLVWALAVATHAACFPMALASIAALGGVSRRVRPAALAAGGLALGLVPVALLNRVRFHSLNPLSYGPVPWKYFSTTNPVIHQNVAEELAYAKPCLVFGLIAGAIVIATALLLRRRALTIGVTLAAIAVGAAIEPVRLRSFEYLRVVFGYVVDMSVLEIGGVYHQAPDGVGQFLYGWLVRSTLQCTPLLVLAPLAARRTRLAWLLLAPAGALYSAMALRANMGIGDALGLPWVYLRYTVPALPILVVLALTAAEPLLAGRRPRRFALLVVAAAAGFGAVSVLLPEENLPKRLLLVVVPLAAAAALLGLAFTARCRAFAWAFGLTVALGLGSSLGQDFRAAVFVKRGIDAWLDAFERAVPERFALLCSIGNQPDDLLTTTATRDVRYALVYREGELPQVRPVIDLWRAEGRPIFVAWKGEPPAPWPDVVLEPVPGIWDIYRLRFDAPSGRRPPPADLRFTSPE